MYQPLVACAACARHVRSSERACPFCAALLTDDDRARVAPDTRVRLGRAALFVFGAAVAVAACGSKDKGGTGSTTGSTSTVASSGSDMGSFGGMYGSSPAVGAGGAGGVNASGGSFGGMYGSPPAVGGAGGN